MQKHETENKTDLTGVSQDERCSDGEGKGRPTPLPGEMACAECNVPSFCASAPTVVWQRSLQREAAPVQHSVQTGAKTAVVLQLLYTTKYST